MPYPILLALYQYLYFFPNDALLNFWAGLISLADQNVLKHQHISIPKTTKKCRDTKEPFLGMVEKLSKVSIFLNTEYERGIEL